MTGVSTTNIIARILYDTHHSDWEMRAKGFAAWSVALRRQEDLPVVAQAVVDEFDAAPIVGICQALLYSISADPAHRAMSAAWLKDHPHEVRQLITEMWMVHSTVAGSAAPLLREALNRAARKPEDAP